MSGVFIFYLTACSNISYIIYTACVIKGIFKMLIRIGRKQVKTRLVTKNIQVMRNIMSYFLNSQNLAATRMKLS